MVRFVDKKRIDEYEGNIFMNFGLLLFSCKNVLDYKGIILFGTLQKAAVKPKGQPASLIKLTYTNGHLWPRKTINKNLSLDRCGFSFVFV